MIKRAIWIILDSVGAGALPDAKQFNDEGTNTLLHVCEANNGLNVPNLRMLGLANIEGLEKLGKEKEAKGIYGKAKELSKGKDTTVGHWEMIGVETKTPFPTYPNGFPKEIIDEFSRLTGRKILGNKVASGTVIIEELGKEQELTEGLIVYTSADSVFQIAANEDIIPLEELYKYCKIARNILVGEHQVGRVIARPYIYKEGKYSRTSNRRDFAIEPNPDNLLIKLKEKGENVVAIGKISDIFCGAGITSEEHTSDNADGMRKTIDAMSKVDSGLIFTNLVEFDSKWGHRNDSRGYAKGLEEFDIMLKEILDKLTNEDILVINADHGCDPTTKGTDHTREYIPVIVFGKKLKSNVDLGVLNSFADIGQTLAEIFNTDKLPIGDSFWDKLQ